MAVAVRPITEATPFDILVIEALADPELRPWANDVIDIVTARRRKEVTELEADFLLWNIDETRAAQALKNPESLAQVRRLCKEARARIRGQ